MVVVLDFQIKTIDHGEHLQSPNALLVLVVCHLIMNAMSKLGTIIGEQTQNLLSGKLS